jgi:hypothetical protein
MDQWEFISCYKNHALLPTNYTQVEKTQFLLKIQNVLGKNCHFPCINLSLWSRECLDVSWHVLRELKLENMKLTPRARWQRARLWHCAAAAAASSQQVNGELGSATSGSKYGYLHFEKLWSDALTLFACARQFGRFFFLSLWLPTNNEKYPTNSPRPKDIRQNQ